MILTRSEIFISLSLTDILRSFLVAKLSLVTFLFLLEKIVCITNIKVIKSPKNSFSAATEIERDVKISSVINWPGSLIAVLNLIIDNAPTNPRDKAIDDFMTLTIKLLNLLIP